MVGVDAIDRERGFLEVCTFERFDVIPDRLTTDDIAALIDLEQNCRQFE